MKKYDSLLHECTKEWGKKPQILTLVEEMAELTKELLKNVNRKKDNRNEIVKEMADVYILMEQMKNLYEISPKEMDDVIDLKMEKLMKHMKEWKENKK